MAHIKNFYYGFLSFYQYNLRFLCHSQVILSEKKLEKPGIKVKKVIAEDGTVSEVKKKIYTPRITLLSPDNSMQITTKEEAEKIADRRNLKLRLINNMDSKSNRPVYRLIKEATKERNPTEVKMKMLALNATIGEHDLQSKIKSIPKWIASGNIVKVTISGDTSFAEKVYETIQSNVADQGRLVQKVLKESELKFKIIQPKKTAHEITKDSTD